jgi:hypothetical protein
MMHQIKFERAEEGHILMSLHSPHHDIDPVDRGALGRMRDPRQIDAGFTR